MLLSEEDRAALPRALADLAARRLEYGLGAAMEGSGGPLTHDRLSALSLQLHDVGQDLIVIADAIAALTQEETGN